MKHSHPQSWYGIEGTKNGKPELFRARNLSKDESKKLGYPHLFVLTRLYTPQDNTYLPSGDDYQEICQFEEQVIEQIEEKELGIIVWTRTSNGSVEHNLYVRDVDRVSELINNYLSPKEQVGIATNKDDDWKVYQEFKFLVGLE